MQRDATIVLWDSMEAFHSRFGNFCCAKQGSQMCIEEIQHNTKLYIIRWITIKILLCTACFTN